MSAAVILTRLAGLGYRFEVVGDRIRYRYQGPGKPDPETVQPLLEALKAHKAEALAWLRQVPAPAEATCYDCAHFRPARGENPREAWGFCRHLGKGRFGVAQACSSFQGLGEKRPENGHATKTGERGKAVFNRTNDRIEWAAWTWNPVTGCKHGCSYCYARDIARRFFPREIGFNPHFWPERLSAPQNTPVPNSPRLKDRLVFTVSMGDLFGDWVPQEWIDAVLDAAKKAPQWTFIFLTKNPRRYLEVEFPPNAWVGATADTQARAAAALEVFAALHHGHATVPRPSVLFLSMEPLREEITLAGKLPVVDWLIIGGQSKTSGEPARQPERGWVERLFAEAQAAGVPVFCKPNLTVAKGPREYPRPGVHLVGHRPGDTLALPEIVPPRASHEVAGGPEAAVTCSCGCPAWDVGRDGRPYCWACLAAQRMTH